MLDAVGSKCVFALSSLEVKDVTAYGTRCVILLSYTLVPNVSGPHAFDTVIAQAKI